MATYTSHYNLKKPATSDKIRIADFNGNADTIDATMYDNASLGAQLKADIGIVENTNTATHNISAGQYVIWKGALYTASSAISSGATLSSANLTAVSGGGLNALNSKLTNLFTTSSYDKYSGDGVSGYSLSNSITVSPTKPAGYNTLLACIGFSANGGSFMCQPYTIDMIGCAMGCYVFNCSGSVKAPGTMTFKFLWTK